jgi:hypothetical protein
MANMTIVAGATAIPSLEVQELSSVVNAEFRQRAVVSRDSGRPLSNEWPRTTLPDSGADGSPEVWGEPC